MGPDDLRCLIQTRWDQGPDALLAQQKVPYFDLKKLSAEIGDAGSA
jgi:hypothetical protein